MHSRTHRARAARRRARRRCWLGALALVGVACGAPPADAPAPSPARANATTTTTATEPSCESGYLFTLDGHGYAPRVLSMRGAPDAPQAGDVVIVEGIRMVLGPPGTYEYRVGPARGGAIERRDELGAWRLVGLTVSSGAGAPGVHTFTSAMFAALPKEEVQGLRGLVLETWGEDNPGLRAIDPARTFVSLEHERLVFRELFTRAPIIPPELPESLEYLGLHLGVPSAAASGLDVTKRRVVEFKEFLARGSRLHSLRFLALRGSGGSILGDETVAFDIRPLLARDTLEYLELDGLADIGAAPFSERVGALPALRVLDVSGDRNLAAIDFVAQLPQLQRIELRDTGVTSLDGLSGHPALERVIADGSPVAALPGSPPSRLQELSLLQAEPTVPAEARAWFERAAPGVLRTDWGGRLRETLRCATRLRVRSGGLCHRRRADERTLFESAEPSATQELISLLAVNGSARGFHCMCCGSPSLELYRGARLLAALGFHHGLSLRWHGWPGDAALEPEQRARLCTWLSSHGVDGACGDAARHVAEAERGPE